MDVIDGSWIKARLPDTHGSQKKFASAIGLQPDQVTKILKGDRKVQAHEIPKILAYFSEAAPLGLSEAPADYAAPKFAEPIKPSAALNHIIRIACPGTTRPFYYRATRSEPLAAVLCGDILVIEHGNALRAGDLVLISAHGEAGEGINELRRHIAPFLVSLDLLNPMPVVSDDSQKFGILGRLAAVLRLPSLTAAAHP